METRLEAETLIKVRSLAIVGAVAVVAFDLVLDTFVPTEFDFTTERYSLAAISLLFVVTTYLSAHVRRHSDRYIWILILMFTGAWLYNCVMSRFSFDLGITMFNVVLACSLVFRDRKVLFWYLVASTIGVCLAFYLTDSPIIHPASYLTAFAVLCGLVYFVLGGWVANQHKLRRSEAILSAVFNESPDALTLSDAFSGVTEAMNKSGTKLFGSREGAGLRSLLKQVTTSDNQLDTVTWRYETELETLAGLSWGDVWVRQIEFAAESLLLTRVTDLTDRKKVEQMLSQQQDQLLRTQSLARVAGWEIDPTSGDILLSAGAFSLLDLPTPDEAQKIDIDRYLADESRESLQSSLDKLRDSGEGFDLEVACRTATNRPIWLRVLGKIGASQSGHRVRGMVQDVSEAKRSELELVEAKDIAEQALQTRSQFLANMSHEIRTPMNGVIGMTSLLSETALTDEQQEMVTTVRVSSESLLKIINDVLDFSKMDGGHIELERHSFNVEQCVAEAMELMVQTSSGKKLELAYIIESQVPQVCVGDTTRLRQVIVNLVSNAIKFTDEGEVFVTIGGEQKSEQVYTLIISVSDTGEGIAADKLENLFDPFTQLDASTTRKYGGTGLGLSICKQLVELMGGHIDAQSKIGVGSTFSFTVEVEMSKRQPDSALSNSLAGRRIVAVDDNATNRRVLKLVLEQAGVDSTIVEHPRELLEELQCGTYDAAILDLQMPAKDGLMLAAEIRKAGFAALPLILLSSAGISRTDQFELFTAVINKPVRPSLLLQNLSLAIDKDEGNDESAGTTKQPGIHFAQQRDQLRILLAEDNQVNQMVATKMLLRLGHEADVATNGVEAVNAIQQQSYDLVFMDVQMPELDGLEATKRIRADSELTQPYIIAMTANAMEGDKEVCLAAGMDSYMSKPITISALTQAIADSLRERQA